MAIERPDLVWESGPVRSKQSRDVWLVVDSGASVRVRAVAELCESGCDEVVIEDVTNGWEYEARGWYFCAQKPEHAAAHRFWITTEVIKNTSGSSAAAGDINESDVILTDGADNFLVWWFDDIGSAASLPITYCRIGTKDPAEETCTNPFQ